MRRRLLVGLLVVGVIETATGIALAGGSVWHFNGEHQPGDIAVSVTSVAWDHDSRLGTPAEGPYLVYLVPESLGTDTWPDVPEEGMLVGVVEIAFGPYRAEDGEWYGPHHAIARLEIPEVPPGIYRISHCNDPCTTTLGDIIGGGGLQVVAGSRGRSPTEIEDEVRESLATYRHPVPPPEPEQPASGRTYGSDEMLVAESVDPEPASKSRAPTSPPPTSLATGGGANREDDGSWNASWSVVMALSLVIGLVNLIRWQREPVRSHLVPNHSDDHSSANRR